MEDGADQGKPRVKHRGGKGASAALLAGTLLLAFVAVEIGVRVLAPQPVHAFRFTTNTWWEPTPGTAFTYERSEFRQRIRYNSHGLRDREISHEKPDGVKRIVVMGDSYAEARQVALSETFCRRLEDRLNRAPDLPAVEVINLGVSGFGTVQQMKRLQRDGFRYEPDWVLYLACGNDFWDNLTPEARRFYRIADGQMTLSDAQVSGRVIFAYRIRNFLKRYVHLYTLLQDRIQSLRGRNRATEDVETEEPGILPDEIRTIKGPEFLPDAVRTQVMRIALRKLKTLCAANSAELVASMVTPRDPLSPASLVTYFGNICGEEDIIFVDIAPAFIEARQAGETGFYTVDAHWNPAGHDITSRVLYDFFRSTLQP